MFDPQSPQTKKTNHALAAFLIIQVIFIISLIISIPQLSNENRVDENNLAIQPQVSIAELPDDVPGLQPSNLSHVQRALFNIILDSESTADKTLNAVVRYDTVITKHFESPNIDYFNAIVDIPDLDLSYQVYYSYTNPEGSKGPNDNIVILCADDASGCKSPYSTGDLKRLVYSLLRYSEFDKFTLNLTDTAFTSIGLNLADEANAGSETYIEQVRNSVSSLGASPDLFVYYIVKQNNLDFKIPVQGGA